MFGFGKKKAVRQTPDVAKGSKSKLPGRKGKKRSKHHAGPYSSEQRRQAVEAFLKSGMTRGDFARTWGMSLPSLSNWVKVYEKHGLQGLEGASLRPDAKKRGRKGLPASVRSEILAVKQENPEAGYRGVRNLLWRFRGVKVSPNTVGRTLREAEIAPVPPRRKKRRTRKKSKVQRFERALPMQLWQTDITSLVLTRHSQRVYLTVFLDDHSRYVVSWALALQQTKEFVMETLLSGISRFGKPEEVLTDQGRQYFSWRGKSDFRKLLRKQGIKHVVSRAHHPETVGKCERFWETVKSEFWDRVEPQELMDARERFDHFVKHYNHFRPHQGLDGLTPADRFFGAATEVRRVIEETISKNELKLAVGETPRKPVFLIGQIGDTPVSLHGEKGQLLLQTPDGLTKRLDYEDFGHGKEQPTAKPNEGEKAYDEGANEGHKHGTSERGNEQSTAQTAEEPKICPAPAAGSSSEGTMADGQPRPEKDSARSSGSDHGVLAGEDHQAGGSNATQDVAASSMAALAASDFWNGGGPAHPTQDESRQGSEESGISYHRDESREQSSSTAQEDRITRKDDGDAGQDHRDSEGDAGLQRCENPGEDQGTNAAASGGNSNECNCNQGGKENDESGTRRRSS
jgi:transposase InsO family protein